jgi:hypothetical protein
MPSTTLELFEFVTEVSTGDAPWTNEANVLNDTPSSTATSSNFGIGQTDRLDLDTPISGGYIPGNATITNIRIDVNWRVTGIATASGSVYLISSSTKTDGVSGSLDTYTFEGDLAYWGLTQQQAKDFANGTRPLSAFMTQGGGNVDQFQMAWAKAQFDYLDGPVAMPVFF